MRKTGRTISLILAIGSVGLSLAGQFGRLVPALDPANALAPFVLALSIIVCIAGLRYGRIILVMGALALLCSAERVFSARPSSVTGAVAPTGSGITVLSLNAWHYQERPEETARALAASGADIILLQEAGTVLQVQDDRLRDAYPFRSDCPEDCDLAILARLPVRDFRYRMEGSDGKLAGPRIVFADIAPAAGRRPMTVASIHVDRLSQGGSSRSDLADRLAQMFEHMGKDDLVIGGDFNMTPYSFAYSSAARILKPIRRVSAGDASFPEQIGGHGAIPVFAIDHIFASPRWHAVPIEAGADFHSDHAPVAVTLYERIILSPS